MTRPLLPPPFGANRESSPEALFQESGPLEDIPSLDLTRPLQEAPEPLLPSSFGRFQIRGFLGKGGMGRVYEAFDPHLERAVALKLLSAGGPEEAERLLKEARAQARIDHPHVVKVFECGVHDGQAYLAMQLVKGTTLQVLGRELTPREVIQLLIQACYGVHAAHEQGLLHRDLKPGNLLVEPRSGGGWTAFVADFGLARPATPEETTHGGQIMGTPGYMSPEQVQHQSLDRRADVWALGVCLFDALAGCLPFQGGDLYALLKAIVTDPAPDIRSLRPGLPEDLDWICRRCLAKDRDQRYASALALAEDLEHLLRGMPVSARPPLPSYRLKRWAGRHRALAAFGLLSALLLAGGAAWGLVALNRARLRGDYTVRYIRAAEELEGAYLRAQTLPFHDMGAEGDLIRRRLEELRRDLARVGKPGAGPLHYALGRGRMLLQEHAEARTELEAAWKAGFCSPETAMALGLVLTELYQEALSGLRGTARENRRSQLEGLLRRPALEYLGKAKGSYFASEDQALGLMALLDGHREEALLRARQVQVQRPGDPAGLLLEQRVHQERVTEALEKGQFPEAEAALEAWRSASQGALEQVRSAPSLHLAELRRWRIWLSYRIVRGMATARDLDQVLEAGRRALAVDGHSARVHGELALIQGAWADGLQDQGRDSRHARLLALAELERAVALAPRDGLLWGRLGSVCNLLANLDTQQDRDPAAFLARGREALEFGLRHLPDDPELIRWLGTNLTLQARVKMDQDQDPGSLLAEAESTLRRTLPNLGAYLTLGVLFKEHGEFLCSRGGPWEASFRKAQEAVEAGLKESPRNPKFIQNKLLLLKSWAEARLVEGGHLLPLLEEGTRTLAEARAVNPASMISGETSADLLMMDFLHRVRQEQPLEDLPSRIERALADIRHLNDTPFRRFKWAVARLESAARNGKRDSRALAEGSKIAETLLGKAPRNAGLWMRKAALLHWASLTEPAQRRAELERLSQQARLRALEINPKLARYEARFWTL